MEFIDKIKRSLESFLDEYNGVLINTGRKKEDVKILFAVKYLYPPGFSKFLSIVKDFFPEKITIGENRVQRMVEKRNYIEQNYPELLNQYSPVMIGNLQTNKINKALGYFSEIHSVDSLELAGNIDMRAKNIIPVHLEVNVSGEETKHGFRLEDIDKTLKKLKLYKKLNIGGLMTMAPLTGDQEAIRQVFRKLKQTAFKYNLLTSMGMSNDWKIAVEEGTDMIRIGSAVFG